MRIRSTAISTAVFAFFSFPALADSLNEPVTERTIVDNLGERGIWRDRVLHVFDKRTRTLVARHYRVFDPRPELDLDFFWVPGNPTVDRDGRIFGRGRLEWRTKSTTNFDSSGVYSEYVGEMRDGRPNGFGRYTNRDGTSYEGQWRNGRFEGSGALALPSGEEFIGHFVRGAAEGEGRYVDITGEIFEGRFVAGRREGAGRTTLPGGLTYRSQWAAGHEVPGSLRIRFAQAGAQTAGSASSDTLRLGATVQKKPLGEFMATSVLGYSGRANGDVLNVEPDDAQLVSVWKKRGVLTLAVDALKGRDPTGDRQGLFGFLRGGITPPMLAFEFQNRSGAPAQITGFYLDVTKSERENHPALEVARGYEHSDCTHELGDGHVGNFAPYFKLTNYGWSPVEHASLNFRFARSDARNEDGPLPFTASVPYVDKTGRVDLIDAIARAGGNLNLLRKFGREGFRCQLSETNPQATNPQKCLAQLRTSGAFGELGNLLNLSGIEVIVGLRGVLKYQYKDARGELVSDSAPVSIPVTIAGLIEQPECGEGAPPEPIRVKSVELKLDQTGGYRISLPLLTGSIGAGQSKTFTLPVAASQASHHVLQLVAQLSDGREVRSRTVDLLYFLPKWSPKF